VREYVDDTAHHRTTREREMSAGLWDSAIASLVRIEREGGMDGSKRKGKPAV
jgi:hypothetical protein